MSDHLHIRLETAATAMEAREWPGAISLLVGALAEIDGGDQPSAEAMTRMLLAQSFASVGSLRDAMSQVADALEAAERSEDRDLIHRCIALRASLSVLER